MTTGAIYAHFPGRAALIAAAVESRTSSVVAELEEEGPLPQRLFDVAVRLLADPERTANPLEIEALVAARREPELASLLGTRLDSLHDRIGQGIAAAQQRGEIAADIDARAAAYFCHALLLGLVLLDSATDQKPAPDEWESLVRSLVAGLIAGPVPPR
jgi:AcrR family transcriptional regulator